MLIRSPENGMHITIPDHPDYLQNASLLTMKVYVGLCLCWSHCYATIWTNQPGAVRQHDAALMKKTDSMLTVQRAQTEHRDAWWRKI